MVIHVSGLFTLILPFYFLLYLPPPFLFLNYTKSVVNLHNSCNESVDASDELVLSTNRSLALPLCYDHDAANGTLRLHQLAEVHLLWRHGAQEKPHVTFLGVLSATSKLSGLCGFWNGGNFSWRRRPRVSMGQVTIRRCVQIAALEAVAGSALVLEEERSEQQNDGFHILATW